MVLMLTALLRFNKLDVTTMFVKICSNDQQVRGGSLFQSSGEWKGIIVVLKVCLHPDMRKREEEVKNCRITPLKKQRPKE